MATELDKIHCRVLAMRQESGLRRGHFVKKGMSQWYLTERAVEAELDRVLALFEAVQKEPSES